MSNIEESIDVNVPVSVAYNQWTQFEEFPRFMEGVEEVRQLDDQRLHWKTKIAGVEREFEAEITEQRPDERIAWKATGDARHAGVVTFHYLDDESSRVMLQLDTEPEGLVEKAGDALGIVKRRVTGDMARFKELIETRGTESGSWRGEIERPDQRSSDGEGRFTGAPAEQPKPNAG